MRLQPVLFTLLFTTIVCAQSPDSATQKNSSEMNSGYKIEQPGTITFTVGVKIKGKVEKPQVVIFLPKEKSQYREMKFSYSFQKDIMKPLPFEPLIE